MSRSGFFVLVAPLMLIVAIGCEHEPLDYYPHHETPTTRPDVVKSGTDFYGGHNSTHPIVIAGSGSATNPGATAPSTSQINP